MVHSTVGIFLFIASRILRMWLVTLQWFFRESPAAMRNVSSRFRVSALHPRALPPDKDELGLAHVLVHSVRRIRSAETLMGWSLPANRSIFLRIPPTSVFRDRALRSPMRLPVPSHVGVSRRRSTGARTGPVRQSWKLEGPCRGASWALFGGW